MAIISSGFCIFSSTGQLTSRLSQTPAAQPAQHQAGHQLILIFEEYRGFTQQVTEGGQNQNPQQAAHPVKELEAGIVQTESPAMVGSSVRTKAIKRPINKAESPCL